MLVLLAAALSIAPIVGSVLLHYEAIRVIARVAQRRLESHRTTLLAAVIFLLVAHLAEVALFAVAFYLGTNGPTLGSFVSASSMSLADYFYFAAQTYSSLGYGDISPIGTIRLLAAVTPLTGLLLLGWSSAFLASLANREAADQADGDSR